MTTTAFDDQFAPEPQGMPERAQPAAGTALTLLDDLLRQHRENRYDITYSDLVAVRGAMEQPPSGQSAALSFADALRIARGCKDYGGGYRYEPDLFKAYQAGISTVIVALTAAGNKGLADSQVRALHSMGTQPAAATVPADERGTPDIAEFGELIDDYQCAQKDGSEDKRARARIALMAAYRAALAAPAAPQAGEDARPVAYLDIGAGGYMDVGTDLTDKQLAALPKGRHMLGIIGTYGVDGYTPQPAAQAAPAVPQWPRVFGVSRDIHPRCLVISLAAEPTDDQVRAIHAALTTQGESHG